MCEVLLLKNLFLLNCITAIEPFKAVRDLGMNCWQVASSYTPSSGQGCAKWDGSQNIVLTHQGCPSRNTRGQRVVNHYGGRIFIGH